MGCLTLLLLLQLHLFYRCVRNLTLISSDRPESLCSYYIALQMKYFRVKTPSLVTIWILQVKDCKDNRIQYPHLGSLFMAFLEQIKVFLIWALLNRIRAYYYFAHYFALRSQICSHSYYSDNQSAYILKSVKSVALMRVKLAFPQPFYLLFQMDFLA